MTGPDLRIVDKDFSDAILSMGRIEQAFSSMGRGLIEYQPITGHIRLAACLGRFDSEWANKRHDITEALKAYREQLKEVQDTFTDVDIEIAKKTDGGGDGDENGGDEKPEGGSKPPGPGQTDATRPGSGGDTSGPGTPASPSTPGSSTSDTGGGNTPGSSTSDTGGGNPDPLPQTGTPGTSESGSPVDGGGTTGGGGGAEDLPGTGGAAGSADSGVSGGDDGGLPSSGSVDSAGTDKLPQTGGAEAAGNPLLNESQYPAIGKMREMLGNAADVSLVSSPDGALSMKIGSVSGLSLAAVTAVLAKRGAAGGATGSTSAFGAFGEASQASASSSAELRQALSSINGKDGEALPGAGTGPDRDSILAGLLGDGSEGAEELKESGRSLDSQASTDAADRLDGPLEVGGTEAVDLAASDEALPDIGLPKSGGLDDGSGSSGLSDPLPLSDSGGSLPGGGSSGSLTDGMLAASDPAGAEMASTSSSQAGPLPASPSTTAPAATTAAAAKDTSHTSAPMLGGMGMAAGLGASSAVQSGDEDKRNEEARRLRDQLLTLKEKD